MRSNLRLTNGLALAALLVLASSCASKEPRLIAYRPIADLKVEAKPALALKRWGAIRRWRCMTTKLKPGENEDGRPWGGSADGQ